MEGSPEVGPLVTETTRNSRGNFVVRSGPYVGSVDLAGCSKRYSWMAGCFDQLWSLAMFLLSLVWHTIKVKRFKA